MSLYNFSYAQYGLQSNSLHLRSSDSLSVQILDGQSPNDQE